MMVVGSSLVNPVPVERHRRREIGTVGSAEIVECGGVAFDRRRQLSTWRFRLAPKRLHEKGTLYLMS